MCLFLGFPDIFPLPHVPPTCNPDGSTTPNIAGDPSRVVVFSGALRVREVDTCPMGFLELGWTGAGENTYFQTNTSTFQWFPVDPPTKRPFNVESQRPKGGEAEGKIQFSWDTLILRMAPLGRTPGSRNFQGQPENLWIRTCFFLFRIQKLGLV